MLPTDLPQDLPSFLARFGTDEQCRAYLVEARWPEGFRCAGCGHRRAWAHKARLIDECAACGKQHSLLAGTIFEQTKTGLARWFLAIYLVTSSKGGISAMELKRQMGFGSYQTAWSWLHKIRKAMVRPERPPLSERVEADETYLGAAKPGRPGRGAAGKLKVAGVVESGRGQARGRRLGRLRLAVVADVSARSLAGFLGQNVARPATVATDGWSGYAGLAAAGYAHEPLNLSASWGDAVLRPAGDPSGVRPRQALAAGHPPRRGLQQTSAGLSRRVRVPFQPPHRQEHQPPLRSRHPARRPDPAHHLPQPRRSHHHLMVMDS
jgi:ISXO2-like transposase domain/Transposase zinc-ribbon domain